MKNIFKYLISLSLIVFFGCAQEEHGHDHEHEASSTAVTQWTNKMELFMEYEIAAVNNPIKFIVHLTTLNDFKPILGGDLTLRFTPTTGQPIEVKTNTILRDGIFTPVKKFEQPGEYHFTLHYKGENVEESFDIGEFIVYGDSHDFPQMKEEGDEGISYLKEQQWKTDFRSEPVRIMPIHASVVAMGEVLPRQQSFVEITAPVDGIVDVAANRTMINPGGAVKTGTNLLRLKPPVDARNSWVEWLLEFERINKEYERAEKLHAKSSISIDKFEKIKYGYLIQKAKYSAILPGSDEQSIVFNTEKNTLEIKSPIAGIAVDMDVQLGQKVTAGQKLMTIVDPTKVWLKLNLFEKDFYSIDSLHGAAFTLPGNDEMLTYSRDEITLLSKGSAIDREMRTIPVFIEIRNTSGLLKIGQTVQVELYTSEHKEQFVVPKHALFDDDGKSVLFVHAEGEAFEKRNVVTGGSNNGWVAILQGVTANDRIVTVGGYQVKLASTSAAIGHPHSH